MIRVDRYDLRELARIALLANTPYSLYHALAKSPPVRRMIDTCSERELREYYDMISARRGRSEVDVGLAYAVLVALLSLPSRRDPVDSSRLRWGGAIDDLITKSATPTQREVITFRPTAEIRQPEPGRLIVPRAE
jgi:hypothetical protein